MSVILLLNNIISGNECRSEIFTNQKLNLNGTRRDLIVYSKTTFLSIIEK